MDVSDKFLHRASVIFALPLALMLGGCGQDDLSGGLGRIQDAENDGGLNRPDNGFGGGPGGFQNYNPLLLKDLTLFPPKRKKNFRGLLSPPRKAPRLVYFCFGL